MTKDEIIAMAKEAVFSWLDILTTTNEDRLEMFYNIAHAKGALDGTDAQAKQDSAKHEVSGIVDQQ